MRYFQGAPLQVFDLADGWARVRMGMEGDSLEGYIRQERLKYGAEAMREITQYASMPGFESDVIIYQACDEQSDIVETVQGPCGIKIMGYNGQWAAIWGRNGFIPYDVRQRQAGQMGFGFVSDFAAGRRNHRGRSRAHLSRRGAPKADGMGPLRGI